MSDQPYVPTTDEVRRTVGLAVDRDLRDELRADFDRWLDRREAEVRRDERERTKAGIAEAQRRAAGDESVPDDCERWARGGGPDA